MILILHMIRIKLITEMKIRNHSSMQNIKVNKKYLAFPHFETSELFTKLRRNDKLQTEIGKSTKLHIAQDYVYIVKWWKMKSFS
jgi:hypothetical protein